MPLAGEQAASQIWRSRVDAQATVNGGQSNDKPCVGVRVARDPTPPPLPVGVIGQECWSRTAPAPTPTASGALERIDALFEIERQASEANFDHDQRQRWRAEHARPQLDALAQFIKIEQQHLLPKTPTMAAIGYVQNHWQALTCYLDHGRCVIDNNAAERALRLVAVGRKNWLFVGSERGGHAAGVFYTLFGRFATALAALTTPSHRCYAARSVESAKGNGLNPRVYLEDALRRLPTTLDKPLDTLLPHHRWAQLTNIVSISP